MTVIWKSGEAAAAVNGRATGEWSASGVSIDSRTVGKGDLFIAIRGPNVDGHMYVGDALSRGAAAAMVAGDWAEGRATADMPLLIVEDTDEGLNALGRAARERGKARVVAITGSVGKTSTKEALAQILSQQAPTTATVGNLNNQWGLPLSMARMPADSVYGVFELGMNHPGELTPLSKLLHPNVALITTVESVHLEFFESEEAIADAKGEIFAGMGAGGAVILNADNRHFDRLKHLAREVGIGRVFSFGASHGADFHLIDWRIEDGGAPFPHPGEYLALGVGDRLFGIEEFQVHGLDVGDKGHIGAQQFRQRRQLAGMVHAQLEHAIDRPGGHAGHR